MAYAPKGARAPEAGPCEARPLAAEAALTRALYGGGALEGALHPRFLLPLVVRKLRVTRVARDDIAASWFPRHEERGATLPLSGSSSTFRALRETLRRSPDNGAPLTPLSSLLLHLHRRSRDARRSGARLPLVLVG